MRWDDLYVAGLGSYLPAAVSTEEAVSCGWYAAEDHLEAELTSTCVAADDEAAPDMAVAATHAALGHAGELADSTALLLYSHLYHQGQDFWNPASYVARRALGRPIALCAQVQQSSNGGMAALELAAGYLNAATGQAAVITTADRFRLPGFDRWASDVGQVYADGATAIVLSGQSGFARVTVTHSTTEPELEELTRDTGQFSSVPLETGMPINLRPLKRRLIERIGHDKLFKRLADGVAGNVREALAQADLAIADIARVVLPNVGRELLEWEFLDPLGIAVERTTWEWGRTISHLGAGDQIAGLHHLVDAAEVGQGDHVLLVGAGLGFGWTSAVVEIDRIGP